MNARTRGVIATSAAVISGFLLAARVTRAQDLERPRTMFVEANGGFGVQLGETDYLPSGVGEDFQFPLVYGFQVGATGGFMVAENLAIIASYEYSRAQTRDGSIIGVLDNVEGRIDYHVTVAGLRLFVPTGFGAVRGDLAVGVALPHSTVLQLDYGPALSQLPTPITGTGTRVDNYSIGFGVVGRLGYQIPIAGSLYAAMDVEAHVFQAENAGETTEYRNFVADFEAVPPVAVDAVVPHGDGAERPHATSMSGGRLLLAVGAEF